MYPSHWLYPLHSKMLLCLTYVSQSLVVPSALEDAPVFDDSHWLYPLHSKMLLCLTYVSQSLVVPSALEDAPVFDDSHWLYPLHSKMLLCLTYVSQSLVVPSVLEDAPVFDVCIPVIGCTLCTRRYSCVWRMYPSHWLYPLYSKMLLCLTYVSQSLVVPSVLEDAPVFDVCIPVIGCTLCTRRCSCVWRMYPSHWLYPLYSKMLLCLTYVSQSLVVPSVFEDAPVFDVCIPVIGCTLCTRRCSCVWRMYPSHWLYPLHSKMLLCLTYVSQSLVVPSVLEDAPVFDVCIPVIGCTLCTRRCSCVWRQSLVVPSVLEDTPVFDVCIPVIGCTLCTRRCSCVWRMYPSHWLYPLYSKMLLCLTTVIGCTLCTRRCSCVWRMYPSHWLYPLYSKILLCLTYVSQSLVVPSVLEDAPVFDVCIPVIGCTLCTRRCSCVWRQSLVVPSVLEDAPVFDDSHWLYPLHSKMLLCFTYVSQSLVVPSALEDAPVFDVCIPVIGCTLYTLRYSCVWRMYPRHWLYPLYSKMLLCLTYVSQSLVVPSVLEDAPVFDVCIPDIGCTLCTRRYSCVWRMYPSHWLYPLHSKMLLCLTYVSQSLVVPSVLEDAPVFDVCIPVIGCTLYTRRCSCVWRMYPSHWLYPLHSKMLMCLTYVSQSLVVPSALEDAPVFDDSHWLYPLHSKILLCFTYVSQSLVVPSVLEDAPVVDVCIQVIGCTLCTLRCSCVWRMYPSHWLYPLYSKMLLCLTTVIGCTLCTRRYSCVLRMYPSHWLYPLYSKMLLWLTYVIPVIGCTLCTLRCSCVWRMYPSHWLYPLHSKMLLCLTYVSQSLVVPSVLEDAPVFDVCIPVIGCTLCTLRYSCVWRMYPSHWLYPLGYTRRYSCVWRMYPSHWLYPLYSKILLCLTYVSQSLVVPSVL